MKKEKKILDLKIDEKEAMEAPKSKSDRKKEMEELIEEYKKQNPVKAKQKEERGEFEKLLKNL